MWGGACSQDFMTIAAIGPNMIPNVTPSSASCCQYWLAEKRLLRCAVAPTCRAAFATMCTAATCENGSGVESTSSAVWPRESATAAE